MFSKLFESFIKSSTKGQHKERSMHTKQKYIRRHKVIRDRHPKTAKKPVLMKSRCGRLSPVRRQSMPPWSPSPSPSMKMNVRMTRNIKAISLRQNPPLTYIRESGILGFANAVGATRPIENSDLPCREALTH